MAKTQESTIVALHGFTGCPNDFRSLTAASSHTWIPQKLLPSLALNHSLLSTHDYPHFLLGYSMGGRVALSYAVTNPPNLQGLILVSTTPGIENQEERNQRRLEDENLAKKVLELDVPTFLDYWSNQPMIQSQQHISADLRSSRLNNTKEYLASLTLNLGQGTSPNLWPMLPKINCPILLINGANDHKFINISKHMLSSLSNAEHTIVKDTGHGCYLEDHQEFTKILNKFIEKNKKLASF